MLPGSLSPEQELLRCELWGEKKMPVKHALACQKLELAKAGSGE